MQENTAQEKGPPQYPHSISVRFSIRSCGAYLFEMDESERLLNDSTNVYIFSTKDEDCNCISLNDKDNNLYFFPIQHNSFSLKISEFMYIICRGNRYLGIALQTFVHLSSVPF